MPSPSVVLDTNVCLDLFVFRDPKYTGLLDALKNGSFHAITRTDCREEWIRVLNYPNLPLNDQSRQQCILEFDQFITCIDQIRNESPHLPTCTDQDDQKFLELAYAAKAQFLISKDKALIKLAKKTAKAGLFQIIKPSEWQIIC